MSLTLGHNRMISNAPNNVRDFGATGDGSTDDSAAIQLALNNAGEVYMPAGTYIVNSTLFIKSNTRLFGDGIEATIIKEGGTLGTTLSTLNTSLLMNENHDDAAGNDSIRVENIAFHGNRPTPVSSGAYTPTNRGVGGIYLGFTTRSHIRDCYFRDGWSGFVITGTRTNFSQQIQNSIFDCTVFNSRSWSQAGNAGTPRGILVQTSYTYMRGCSTKTCSTGFYIGGENVTAESCNAFEWDYDNGFYCLAPYLTMSNCRADGGNSSFPDGFGNGITLAYNIGAQLTNCTVRDCSNMGFRLHAPQRNTNLTNCQAYNCGYGFRSENTVSFTGTTVTSANQVINVAPSGTSNVTVRMVSVVFADNPVGSVARETYGATYNVSAQTLFNADGWLNMSGANVGFNGSFPVYSVSGNTIKYISEDAPVDSNYPTTNNPQPSGGTPVVKYCTHDINLNNVLVDDAELDGIQLRESGNIVISNCTIKSAKRYGVYTFDSRAITVSNSMFYETYQAAVYSEDCRNICVDNIKTYDTKGSVDTSSLRGVVTFFQTQGLTITNVVGTSYKTFWIAQVNATEAAGLVSTGLIKDNFRTDNITQVDFSKFPIHYEGSGAGTPLNVVSAGIGSVWYRNDGGANTTLYIKESGQFATGWVAK